MNGVMFNGEGPMMQGTWYNPINGDTFTVRDSFFQDNQFIVSTTDGRMLNYNQLQNYIQSDKPVNKMDTKSKKDYDDIPSEVTAMLDDNHFGLLEEDRALINKSLNDVGNSEVNEKRINLSQPIFSTSDSKLENQTSNYNIIDRALSKTQLPKIKVSVDWGNKEPQKEIQLLTEVMDISITEIVGWYISKFNINDIKDNVHTCIEKLLYNKYDNMPDNSDKPKTKKEKKAVVSK